jgi:hypothetical protein
MDLYFASAVLSSGRDIGIPGLQVRTEDVSHYFQNRGFQITGSSITHFDRYDAIRQTFARYGVIPSSDMVIDIDLDLVSGSSKKTRLEVELASNDSQMIQEVLPIITGPYLGLDIKKLIYPVKKEDAHGNFRGMEYGNREVQIFSVAQLKEFLEIK